MAEHESPVIEATKQPEVIDKPKYSDEEETYIRGLKQRLENARNSREQEREEFDGMAYASNYAVEEHFANTYIVPKQNKEDTNFQSGTVRQKIFALLSAVTNLNLAGDISAFDKEGLEVQALGDAMEDIMLKTNELDKDDEKKQVRHYELLKHGTVFVEEIWDQKFKKVKKMSGKFDGKLNAQWTERLKKAFARPTRNIIPGINVFLGDMSQYDIADQPHIFTVDVKHYDIAKTIFQEWDRWDNVPKKIVQTDATLTTETNYNPNWRLLRTPDNYVEIIRYQDKWNNEFAVLLNGVLMTPVGLPLPWGYEDYNIAQQNLEPIHAKFSYGRSLVMKIKNKVALMDELMRLAVLKTQKSFMPPYINISGRVLSNRVLMPGKITYGIEPNTLIPINDKETQGVTTAEFNMIKELEASINAETTSPTFQGQQAEGNPTATEIIELQRQAKMILGLTVFAVSMLEWKLEWLRLKNLLVNWFQEDIFDDARGVLKQVSLERNIEGEGMGRRILIPSKEIPSPKAIRQAEDALTEEQGMPVRLIFLNPAQVNSSQLTWQIVIRPKEKKTSETGKLLFRAFLQDVLILNPNIEELQRELASVWEKDPKKLFAPNPQQQLPPEEQDQQQGGGQSKTLSPRTNLPTAEKALGQQTKTGILAGA